MLDPPLYHYIRHHTPSGVFIMRRFTHLLQLLTCASECLCRFANSTARWRSLNQSRYETTPLKVIYDK
ncbi:hypothetical protein GYH30_021129 [Glycine max]|uniref:Uncharacterized protein n=1 Tax=Glycine max TaxID=3847 RepID=A0A0R0ILC8_SOYBN|nr:hypothetical protein GYH30_021129 [Glycine max]